MPRAAKLLALASLFAAGALLAGTMGGRAADTTTTDTTLTATTDTSAATDTTATTDTSATTTEAPPATTVVATTTVQQTTTRILPIPAGTTTASSESSTPAWVWALLAILAVGLIVLIVLLARRGGGDKLPVEQRRARLDGALRSWAAQGWAIENDSGDSAVLRRGAEGMLVSVDQAGHVSTRPLPPAEGWPDRG